MGLMADRGATRMQTRQMYRTASRMQRRRSWMEARAGQRQDFEPADEPGAGEPAAAAAPAQPAYVAELEQLAQLRDQGVLSPEEFDAKKRQLLGI
jgi:Short C-terminal domain